MPTERHAMRNFNCYLYVRMHIQRNFKEKESSRLSEMTGHCARKSCFVYSKTGLLTTALIHGISQTHKEQ